MRTCLCVFIDFAGVLQTMMYIQELRPQGAGGPNVTKEKTQITFYWALGFEVLHTFVVTSWRLVSLFISKQNSSGKSNKIALKIIHKQFQKRIHQRSVRYVPLEHPTPLSSSRFYCVLD